MARTGLLVTKGANVKVKANYYTIYRREDGAYVRTRAFNIGKWESGDTRQDPSPCWHRTNNQILVPAVGRDGKSRQLYIIKLRQE